MPVNIYSEEKSPCLGCDHELRDKNHYGCVSCEKRLEYIGAHDTVSNVAKETAQRDRNLTPPKGMISKTLKTQLKPQPETAKIKICSTCKKPKVLETEFYRSSDKPDGYRSECNTCYRKSRDKKYYNRRHGFLIDFTKHKELFDRVLEIAEDQERNVHQQLIFIVKDWLKKQGPS